MAKELTAVTIEAIKIDNGLLEEAAGGPQYLTKVEIDTIDRADTSMSRFGRVESRTVYANISEDDSTPKLLELIEKHAFDNPLRPSPSGWRISLYPLQRDDKDLDL